MNLAARNRPQSWEDFLGNRSFVQAVEAALAKDEKPHSFLITGPSGTGKTTAARLILKDLGCSDLDLTELDSADFRGIETIRDLRRNSGYQSFSGGKHRGWLLDECHQLTKDAQEALLKLLEEPPAHAFFILCTTEPEKLKPTLKRRCLTFDLRPMSSSTIEGLLSRVAVTEKKEVPGEVLVQIASDSLGSPGVALAVLEAIIDLPQEKMLKAAKRRVEVEQEAIALARALMRGAKWPEVSAILKGLQDEPEQVRRLILSYCSTVLLGGDNPKAYLVMDAFRNPFYDDARAKLILASYEVMIQ